jgi:hypothetical protein
LCGSSGGEEQDGEQKEYSIHDSSLRRAFIGGAISGRLREG